MHRHSPPNPTRRNMLLLALLLPLGARARAGQAGAATEASAGAAWDALRAGAIVLFRHANAPGTGDPQTFRLGECSTQRNLDALGRAQATRIGIRLREHGVTVGKVLASQWCRSQETAELAFPGRVTAEPAFNSFFQHRDSAPRQTAQARNLLLQWSGPGALVVVTHQVNISALADTFTASGEGIVLRVIGQDLKIVGRIPP